MQMLKRRFDNESSDSLPLITTACTESSTAHGIPKDNRNPHVAKNPVVVEDDEPSHGDGCVNSTIKQQDELHRVDSDEVSPSMEVEMNKKA